jgi:DNA-directed RNA polymerase specialized sigma24 family protein
LQDADAEEVCQEILAQVYKSIRKEDYRPACGSFRTWLFTVARTELLSFVQRRKGQVQGQGGVDTDSWLEKVASSEQETYWGEDYKRHLVRVGLERAQVHFTELTWQAFLL